MDGASLHVLFVRGVLIKPQLVNSVVIVGTQTGNLAHHAQCCAEPCKTDALTRLNTAQRSLVSISGYNSCEFVTRFV